MIKKAYVAQMSYEISSEEKQQALQVMSCFKQNQKYLDKALSHLEIIYTSFKDSESSDPKEIYNHRSAFRRFRDKVVENFNVFKQSSLRCVSALSPFSSDTQIVKITKSYISSIEVLEEHINDFVKLFEAIDASDFIAQSIKQIDIIKKQCDEIETLINDRVKKYVKENIISDNWVNQVGKELDLKVQKKVPLLQKLHNEG